MQLIVSSAHWIQDGQVELGYALSKRVHRQCTYKLTQNQYLLTYTSSLKMSFNDFIHVYSLCLGSVNNLCRRIQ